MDFSAPPVDAVALEQRAASFQTRSFKTEAKLAGLKLAVSMVDLTTLEGNDTPGKVRALCGKALHPLLEHPDVPPVAAVCVYGNLVTTAKAALADTPVKVAAVATAFPSGMNRLGFKVREVEAIVAEGADEIDMVISRGAFLSGEYRFVYNEIAEVKKACGDAHLKVILETGELETYDNIRLASQIAMAAGADFIKTSTGKAKSNATLPVTLVMLEAIRDYYHATGKMIGMKPAGGISTAKLALQYLAMVKETLGDAWLNNELFRFGASSLLNDLLMQIVKQKTGCYQSPIYFTIS